MPSKIALVLIATGDKYWQFIQQMIDSAKTFFPPHDVVLFTDSPKNFRVAHQIYLDNMGFPEATLMRYHTMLSQKELLSRYEYMFYCDVDMLFVNRALEEDILSEGITATLHPGYINQIPQLERNPNSTAFIPSVKKYYCGGFNGGNTSEFLKMAEVLDRNIQTDKQRRVLAVWHDESHLNKYLEHNPPSKVLSPSYCYPEVNVPYYKRIWGDRDYEPILIAIEKHKDVLQTQRGRAITDYKDLSREAKISYLLRRTRIR